ncbi:MAG TPA: hypothetical protein VGL53_04810 [Bryobacteraceae bacterium]
MAAILAILSLAAASAAAPNPEADAWDVVATMAAALAEPNEYAFMKPIAKSVAEHGYLELQVRALVHTNDVVSSISPVTNEGDDKQRTLEVDWYMQIHPQAPGRSLIERRENIKLTMVKAGKHWMITAISPATFFAAPDTN